MFTKISAAALFAGLAAAYHAPVGDPTGNAIVSPLNEVVPACKPFTIKWQPTTKGPVSLLLLKGPSTNAVYYQTIVEGIDNSGSYTWTPPAGLPSTGSDPHGYGIQLIVDADGQYQYSTQIGIETSNCKDTTSSSSSAGYGSGPSSSAAPSSAAPSSSAAAPSHAANSTSICSTTTHWVAPSSTGYSYSTGAPAQNSTVVLPSKSMTVPSSLLTTATGVASTTASAPPESTGAASGLKAGLSLAGAVAGLVLML